MPSTVVLLSLVVALLSGPGRADGQTVGQVFRNVVPSVVVVRATGREVAGSGSISVTTTGSGVLVSADGKVMTAAHIVHAADEVSVEFHSGEVVGGRVVASEPAADLSLLQLEGVPPGIVAAAMADSDAVAVGDQVIVVGAPYGLRYAMTVGWISARWPRNTVYRAMPLAEFFQTDAVINTGNSGGPMFNLQGQVIGIVSHNISKSGGSEGLGFVVTINTARELLLEARAFWSGVDGRLLTPEQAAVFNVPQPGGYLVQRVARGSPLDRAGLQAGTKLAAIDGEDLTVGGDIILSIDGTTVTTVDDLRAVRARVARMPPGSSHTLTVLRAGRILELTAVAP